jgi:hypothetical protein
MRRYDLGDPVSLRRGVYDLDGALTDTASVTLTVTKPSGQTYVATVLHTSTGIYDTTVPAAEIDELGPYRARWTLAGAISDVSDVEFYVSEDDDEDALPPLASVEHLGRKLGYVPEESERDRAETLLDEASELIRDKAGKTWVTDEGALESVPRRVRLICVASAYRAFTNPEGLTQRSIGDSSKSYDRTSREGGEAVYLTDDEIRSIRKAAGTSSLVAVTLESPYTGTLLDPWVEATLQ